MEVKSMCIYCLYDAVQSYIASWPYNKSFFQVLGLQKNVCVDTSQICSYHVMCYAVR